ncbi:hypothetical protein ACF09K_16810 [Streptomyces sp. NPDC014882]|uniref:hypothetical protein n=1 Tax=Streptomyces sp. NPDC014882 TaxID=3364927 RepID=UPI0036FD26BC
MFFVDTIEVQGLGNRSRPAGEVRVHCAGGARAAVAASLPGAAGRDVAAVDDSFDAAAAAGPAVRDP